MAKRGKSRANSARLAQRYRSAHWGIGPTGIYEVDDPRLPDGLVEMGRLVEVEILDDAGRPIPLAFDPKHDRLVYDEGPSERLFCLFGTASARKMRGLFHKGKKAGVKPAQLRQVARWTGKGARQNRWAYPSVEVVPLGLCKTVTYETAKLGDAKRKGAARSKPKRDLVASDMDTDLYIHECGEESGVRPYLAISEDGCLWWAGGNYSTPDAGITD